MKALNCNKKRILKALKILICIYIYNILVYIIIPHPSLFFNYIRLDRNIRHK